MSGLAQANALHIPFADGVFQCCISSPPYWGLRDYKTGSWVGGDSTCEHRIGNQVQDNKAPGAIQSGVRPGSDASYCRTCGAVRIDSQLGLEPVPDCLGWATGQPCGECYVCKMVQVFREVRRVLRDDGVCFINLGDSYFSNPGNGRGGGSTLTGAKPHLSGVQRVKPYGTFDKEPVDCQGRDCLCGSLCDVCRVVYQSDKAHTDGLLVAMLTASLSESTREHTVLPSDHLPTLGLSFQADHNVSAIPDRLHSLDHEGVPLLVSLLSTIGVSSPQLLDVCLQRDSSGVCLLCAHPISDTTRKSLDKTACPDGLCSYSLATLGHSPCMSDNEETGDSLVRRNMGTAYDSAYLDYSTTRRQLKPKDLCGIPWRVALALQADGWWLRSDCIWSKPNPMPSSVRDRPSTSHEYIFLLAKSARYFWDAEAVKEPQTNSTIERANYGWAGRTDDGSNGARTGSTFRRMAQTGELIGTIPADGLRNLRTVWNISTQPYSGAHYATFPEALVERCVLAGTSAKGCCPACGKPRDRVLDKHANGKLHPAGDSQGAGTQHKRETKGLNPVARQEWQEGVYYTTTGWRPTCGHDLPPVPCRIFDPFVGSGTVVQVARRLGRQGYGLDLSRVYLEENALPRALGKNTAAALATLPLFAEQESRP